VAAGLSGVEHQQNLTGRSIAHGQQNVKSGGFRCYQKVAIF
jgi:hypothetical protein